MTDPLTLNALATVLGETARCMDCKEARAYTVEAFPTGNTGWRCVSCGHILRLIPGTYTGTSPRSAEEEMMPDTKGSA